MSSWRTVPVLMYHHVTPQGGVINVDPTNFEAQLRWLKQHHYQSLTTQDFARHLNGEAAPPRSVLITFDDGYLDNWVYAYPLLRKYGFKATVFLVTSWIGNGPVRPYASFDDSGQRVVVDACLPPTPDHHACERLIQEGKSDDVVLRWSEIQAAIASGVLEFHSHTHTHTRWDLSDQAVEKNERIAWELEQSRQAFQQNLGSVSEHFCWPQGYFDQDYVKAAKAAGFCYLYTTRAFGQNRPGTDPAYIYRFAVRNTSGESVGRRIRVAEHPIIGPIFNGFKRWKRSLRGSE